MEQKKFIEFLREKGYKFRFVTNTTRKYREEDVKKSKIKPDLILPSVSSLKDLLKN